MKKFFILTALFSLMSCQFNAQNKVETLSAQKEETMVKPKIYQFKVVDINGETVDMRTYDGYKILIVNTASECGLTPQYKELQELYETYKEKKFVILAFPANNFGNQEPGTNQEIATFCQKNYGVDFPVMEKVSVKGKDMCPIYQFLTSKAKNGTQDSDVQWNFQKYLINRKGELEKVISPQITPLSKEITSWIES